MQDVIIIGGSYAGLAAALMLGRARRHALVIDAGERRNRFAAASHGFAGQDGESPAAIVARAREDVSKYPTVSFLDARATEARAVAGGFVVRAGASEHRARRLILATGVVDELPAVPGVVEAWGKTAFFCPYCHGYELDGPPGILAAGSASVQQALVVADWAVNGGAVFFVNGAFEPSPEELAELGARGIAVERELVVSVSGDAAAIAVRLRDDRTVQLGGLFVTPVTRFASPLGEQLGCELDQGKLGPIYKTDTLGETTVPGVFACGDVASPKAFVSFAVADGVRAGTAAHQSLIFRRDAPPAEVTAPAVVDTP